MNELFMRHSGQDVEQDEDAGFGFDDELSQHMLNTDPPDHGFLTADGKKLAAAQQEITNTILVGPGNNIRAAIPINPA